MYWSSVYKSKSPSPSRRDDSRDLLVLDARPMGTQVGARYFTDPRFPGMQPIVCTKDNVCSIVWTGGYTVFPAVKSFNDICNTCGGGGGDDDDDARRGVAFSSPGERR